MHYKDWNLELRKKYKDFLFEYITPERKKRFEDILPFRNRYVTVGIENVYQPHNASAVLRSCDCFGVQDVHIIENEYKYELSENVTMGSNKWLDIHLYNEEENNTLEAINTLKSKGYRIVATTPHTDDCLIDDLPLEEGKLCLLFGTELEGLSDIAMEHADEFVKIPMYGFTESFNISVCAALSIYNLSERLRKSDIDWKLSEEEQIDINIEWARRSIRRIEVFEEKFIQDNF
ncbi:MAG: TrmH family RNA methyltransferase [Hyphomicrobiales bacterium]